MNRGSVKRLRATRAVRRATRAYRRANPICERCGVRAAVETHHKVPIHEAPELAAAVSNLEALCRACHEAHHDRTGQIPPPHTGRNGAGWPTTGGGAQVCAQMLERTDRVDANSGAAASSKSPASAGSEIRRSRVPVNDRGLWRLS